MVVKLTQYTCVKDPVPDITCRAVSQHIGFHAPLCGFVREVLNKSQSPFEPDHSLAH